MCYHSIALHTVSLTHCINENGIEIQLSFFSLNVPFYGHLYLVCIFLFSLLFVFFSFSREMKIEMEMEINLSLEYQVPNKAVRIALKEERKIQELKK